MEILFYRSSRVLLAAKKIRAVLRLYRVCRGYQDLREFLSSNNKP